ncbi:hypothetical protein PIB30_096873, partial [Stylosanthes scabra]|nr:hypothetical protein [Stylosanthes scabra]
HLGIEKHIWKAKEGIRSKRFTRGSQEVRNRAPCGRTVPSYVRPHVSLRASRDELCQHPRDRVFDVLFLM